MNIDVKPVFYYLFVGLRRIASCNGSKRCVNETCSYLVEYGVSNKHHIKNNKCKHCKSIASKVPCFARKIWEFDEVKNEVSLIISLTLFLETFAREPFLFNQG